MASDIDIAISLCRQLERKLQDAVTVPEANRISRDWLERIEREHGKKITSLATTFRSVTSRFGLLSELDVQKARGESIIVKGDMHVGDTYQAGQAGAMGPHARSDRNTFSQIWASAGDGIALEKLQVELPQLRAAMRARADGSPEHDRALAAVADAEEAAKQSDGPRVLEHLRRAGKWTLEVAKEVATGVAVNAITTAMTGSQSPG